MNTHALKIAFRNFMRHKSSFFINLIGLSTGLACALVIFLWVKDEMAVDAFHEKDDRLFYVMEHQQYSGNIMTTQSTPGLLAETLVDEIPEIEYGTTLIWTTDYTLTVGDKNIKAAARHAANDFFKIFSWKLLAGDVEHLLQQPNDVVLSRSTAENLFGSVEAAMNQSLERDHDELFTVTGVFEDVPSNSSLQFDLVFNYEHYKNDDNDWLLSWGNNGPPTFVTLVEGADAQKVSEKIANFVKDRNEQSNVTLFLKSFSERYLYGRYEEGKLIGGRIEYVRLFSIIAIFILVIACINFMNLSTARASRRAKEIGVKKALGAEKHRLISQFLQESTLMSLMSLMLALGIVFLFLPTFNLLTEKEISLRLTPTLAASFLGITLLTGLLAGSYPALYLSSFKPVAVLKGELRTSLGELWVRKGLVVFQFTLSIVLIVAVIVVYNQIQFVQNKNLGYDKDLLIYFPKEGRLQDQSEAFIAEAKKLPGIKNVSAIGHNLVGRQNNTSGLNWEGKNPEDLILFENVRVDYELLETIGVEMKEGRTFSRQYGADSSKIIFNERAIEIMNMKEPIGQKIRLWEEYDMEIIGVVKDFHFQSLREGMKPLFFMLNPESSWNIMVRIEPGQSEKAIASLRNFYESYNPGFTFDYDFMNEQYAQQYEAEQRVASLSRYFAGLAILISCLGLFGLAAFTADRRKKEIGIRKVLGATVTNIVMLLTKNFTQLVVISILLGLPIAYFLTRRWLNDFAYRIDLSFVFFLIASGMVLLISWLTVSFQAYRAANINPKECIRNE
jgi:putative ABC transport system permease protein